MWMYEQSLHIPLVIRYPGEINPGTTNEDFVQNIDFAPTFLEYAGVKMPGDLQGRSFRNLLQGSTPDDWRDQIYYHYYEAYDVPEQYGIRTETHKLVCYPSFNDKKYWELFDLSKDPMEMNNVYSDSKYSGVLEDLKKSLAELRTQYDDTEEAKGSGEKFDTIEHLAKNCPVKLKYLPSPKYSGGSKSPLTDGIINNVSPSWSFYYDKWLGFEVQNLDATIDLQKVREVNQITTRFLEKVDSWIFPPTEVKMMVSSDGRSFAEINTKNEKKRCEGGIGYLHLNTGYVDSKAIRYVRVQAKNMAVCPEWHPGAGGKAWLFVDEILVE
jgi:hypothetical protein